MTASRSPVQRQIVVSEEEEGQRLDLFLGPYCPDLSRSRIQSLIEEGSIRVDTRGARPSYRVRAGDRIWIEIPDPRPLSVDPEEIPLDVLFEDTDILVIAKPAGMAVHPAPGALTGTLVNALLHHCHNLSGINGVLRPGIVHRLDRHTTGLLVVAKNDAAHRGLSSQLEARQMRRQYTALAWGRLEQGSIEEPIARHPRDRVRMAVREGGRHAVTHYAPVEHFPFLTHLAVRLETGRTHQIRVHLRHIGHPVFGDPVYGGRSQIRGIVPQYRQKAQTLLSLIDRQALHAQRLGFRHPVTGESMDFEAPAPEDLQQLLDSCRREP